MKFSEIKYTRPNIEQLTAEVKEKISEFSAAESFEEADGLMSEIDKLITDSHGELEVCYIRHTIDTADEFYAAEQDFSDQNEPLISDLMQQAYLALAESPFRADFKAKYGWVLFRNIELMLGAMKPEILPDMGEENKISGEYQKLIASAQVEFDGKTLTLSQLSPYKVDKDDAVRRAAWQAEAEWYTAHGAELDELYDKLVKNRSLQAKKMGCDNYVQLAYNRRERNCYDREDVKKFRENIVKYIVPLCESIAKEKAERLGFEYPMTFADNALDFRDGNPTPQVDSDEILAHAKKFYHELSPETAEFIDFMYENEMLDVLSKKGKAAGGYCSSLLKYKSPFIFANFNGTAHDVEVMTHEAGHAYAYYCVRDEFPSFYVSPSYDAAEVHSTTMEFFAWQWVEGFFEQDADKYRRYHLATNLLIMPYECLVDHFQHEMYEHPELSPSERHDVWKRLLAVYMPWIKLDGSSFYGEGKGWQRQLHIYLYPFYYIDYCFATTVALEFWAKMQQDLADAWTRYNRFVAEGGSKSFRELVEVAGLESPFEPDALREIVQTAKQWLDENK